jgi:hypothetical protein
MCGHPGVRNTVNPYDNGDMVVRVRSNRCGNRAYQLGMEKTHTEYETSEQWEWETVS